MNQIAELQRNLAAVEYKIDLYDRNWVPGDENDPGLRELRRLCTNQEENK